MSGLPIGFQLFVSKFTDLVQQLNGSRARPDATVYARLLLSKKGKVFPYSLPSVLPGADPCVQAVSPQVT